MVAIDDASFWCTLDTGWGGPELGLTKRVVDQHPFTKQVRSDLAPFNAANSSAQVERLHDLNLTIPCLWPPHVRPISLTADGLVTPTLASDADGGEGAIGLSLMERYRITIDYGRGRVLLEPYSQAELEQKQEKAHPKPKQTGI